MTNDVDPEPTRRDYTKKQMGDATEMLVAAELTLAGVPAARMPDYWPHYDVIAQCPDGSPPLRVSVKSRTFNKGSEHVRYQTSDVFDWLAVVILGPQHARRIFIIPRAAADDRALKAGPEALNGERRYWRADNTEKLFGEFENNFTLNPRGATGQRTTPAD
jgi:hypothetical protein